MNKIFLIGNLTSDPEPRTTPNGVSVCTFNLAVNRRYSSQSGERQTDFFRITAWRQLGETCSRYLAKGRKVFVSGEISARAYTAKDGTVRASLEVTADQVEFLTPRDAQSAEHPSNQGYRSSYSQQDGQGGSFGSGSQRQNAWQDGHGSPSQDPFASTPFEQPDNSSDGFTEISDADLPF